MNKNQFQTLNKKIIGMSVFRVCLICGRYVLHKYCIVFGGGGVTLHILLFSLKKANFT